MLTAAVARHLQALGFGPFDQAGASIFLETLPTNPVDAVAVAFKPAPVSDLSSFTVQGVAVLVRQKTGTGITRPGWTRANQIRAQLHGLRHTTLAPGSADEVRLVSMLADDSGPTSLGADATGVPVWSLRFIAQTPADTAHVIV